MSVILLSTVSVFLPIPCLCMSLLSPVPPFSSIPLHLRYTHATSTASACIQASTLASTLCAHRAKTPSLANHANNYLTRASLQLDKKGEIPDEKVLHADCLCQKCMSRNDNVSLTCQVSWNIPSASPPPLSTPSNIPSPSGHFQYCFGRWVCVCVCVWICQSS